MVVFLRAFFLLIALFELFLRELYAQAPPSLIRVEVDTFSHPFKRYHIFHHKQPNRKTLGLALSGGGARGLAQIGVLKALVEKNVPIDYIVGTSMGAIIGGLFCSGYSPSSLDSLVQTLHWQELTSLQENGRRKELFLEQKRVRDRASLTLQFDGLKLIIPKSLSSAQELTETLDKLAFSAIYAHHKSFDDLPIAFGAVATDLVTGKREILRSGSLSEAIRASSAVPLLFLPVDINGKQLVDGGLVSNIAVDALEELQPGVIVAVNTLGVLYQRSSDVDLPWKAADQIMSIMMQEQNKSQLKKARVEIKPDIGGRESSDFTNIAPLIQAGYRAGLEIADSLLHLTAIEQLNDFDISNYEKTVFCADSTLQSRISVIVQNGRKVKATLSDILKTDFFIDAFAELDTINKQAYFRLSPLPRISTVRLLGAREFSDLFENAIRHSTLTNQHCAQALESLLQQIRVKFPLASFNRISFEKEKGLLEIEIDEGKLNEIEYELSRGWTKRDVIDKEIEFDTTRALLKSDVEKSIGGLYRAGIFNRVSFWAEQTPDSLSTPKMIFHLKLNEKFSELLRIGFRVDDIYASQLVVDFRNENFLGTATELGGWFTVGERISSVQIEYRAHRLWDSYFTFFTRGFYSQRKIFATNLIFSSPFSEPDRKLVADYGEQRFGASLAIGGQIYRDGSVTAELTRTNTMLFDNDSFTDNQRLWLTSLKARFTLDTRDNPFSTTTGNYTDIFFEFYPTWLGNRQTFSKFSLSHQENRAFTERLNARLRFNLGFVDNLAPFSEQFSLGGAGASFSIPFYGLRFDDFRGRQVVVVGYDLEFLLPIKLVVPTLLGLRYNLGNIWTRTSTISLREFTHGIGAELILRTPIGATKLAVAKSFQFGLPSEATLLKFAPTVYYFVIGYEL